MSLAPALDPGSLFGRALDVLDVLRGDVTDYPRITDDEHGIVVAFAVSLRADCTRRRVGALIVDVHGRHVDTGRNGAPPGRPGCLSAGACPRGQMSKTDVAPGSSYATGTAGACIALHAETNAVIFSDPMARRGGTIYITDAPCDDCSRLLAGSGLARAVWPERTDNGWAIRARDIETDPIGGLYAGAR